MTPSIRLSRLVLTLFYLAGPLLIIWELFIPALSVPVVLLSAAYFVLLASSLRRDRADAKAWRASHLVAGFAAFPLCVAWVYYSGIGGFAICRWDYVKHNLIFSYLLDQKLPIYTSLAGKDFIVHYSFAYYITPVRLYQVADALVPGIALNGVLLVIYSVALFLATSVLARGPMARVLVLLVILCFTGGLDALGMLAFGVEPQGEVSTAWVTVHIPFNLDWWGIPYAPQSFTMNLYYAPQHFFGALIGTALLFASLQSSQSAAATLIDTSIVIAASVFWSSYVAVGLAALAIVMALSLDTHGTFVQRLRTRRDPRVICATASHHFRLCGCLRHRRLPISFGVQTLVTTSANPSSGQRVRLADHIHAELRALPAGADSCVVARSEILCRGCRRAPLSGTAQDPRRVSRSERRGSGVQSRPLQRLGNAGHIATVDRTGGGTDPSIVQRLKVAAHGGTGCRACGFERIKLSRAYAVGGAADELQALRHFASRGHGWACATI